MKKYQVSCQVTESEDAEALLNAVARYVSSVEYPEVKAILAILGIEEVKEK